MKKLCKRMTIAALCLGAILPAAAISHEMTSQSQSHSYQTLHADQIKAWLDQGKAIVILDARTKEYDDGKRLPNAQSLPHNSSEQKIHQVIPSMDTTVIVYCSNACCPASQLLADRLTDMGYTHVYKYPEGLADWISKGYPIEPANKK